MIKLSKLVTKSTAEFDNFEFHLPMIRVHQFCDNELSSFYIDISKEKLYADSADSHKRRCARSVMWEVLSILTEVIAPVLCFTAEEIWQEMRKMDKSLPESVYLSMWPKLETNAQDESIEARWDRVMEAREL